MKEKLIIETIKEFCERKMEQNYKLSQEKTTLKGDYLAFMLNQQYEELLNILESFED